MKYLTIILFACGMLLLSSCRSTKYTPPRRPTAGMYPTLLPASELHHFTPVQLSTAELEEHLRELSFWEPLNTSHLEQSELDLVVRSLARRGYAELDSRRCDCSVHWVVFVGYPVGRLTIVGETADGQTTRKSWDVREKPEEDAP